MSKDLSNFFGKKSLIKLSSAVKINTNKGSNRDRRKVFMTIGFLCSLLWMPSMYDICRLLSTGCGVSLGVGVGVV